MFKLSPSDFAYLYVECKHCYYLKVKYGIKQPSMQMPGVFTAINTRLQGSLVGKNLQTLSNSLPDGEVVNQEGWVDSILIPETKLFIKGKYDLLVKNPDSTYTLVDLKISKPEEDKIEKYKSQLGAYKFALENPNSGKPIKVSKIALLIFYPNTVSYINEVAKFDFPPKWLEVPVDDSGFISFIKEIDILLSGQIPDKNKKCKWCIYKNIDIALLERR